MIEIPILFLRWPISLVSEFSVIKLGLSVNPTDPLSVGFYPRAKYIMLINPWDHWSDHISFKHMPPGHSWSWLHIPSHHFPTYDLRTDSRSWNSRVTGTRTEVQVEVRENILHRRWACSRLPSRIQILDHFPSLPPSLVPSHPCSGKRDCYHMEALCVSLHCLKWLGGEGSAQLHPLRMSQLFEPTWDDLKVEPRI